MAGRGPQTFLKRQKEQQRKEKQAEKFAKRLERNQAKARGEAPADDMIAEKSVAEQIQEGEAGASVG